MTACPSARVKLPVWEATILMLGKFFSASSMPAVRSVAAVAPVVRAVDLQIELTLYAGADGATAQAAAYTAAAAYVQRIQARLGVDVVPSQIAADLDVYGVYRVNVVSPDEVMVLAPNEWPQITGLTVSVVGDAEG